MHAAYVYMYVYIRLPGAAPRHHLSFMPPLHLHLPSPRVEVTEVDLGLSEVLGTLTHITCLWWARVQFYSQESLPPTDT